MITPKLEKQKLHKLKNTSVSSYIQLGSCVPKLCILQNLTENEEAVFIAHLTSWSLCNT